MKLARGEKTALSAGALMLLIPFTLFFAALLLAFFWNLGGIVGLAAGVAILAVFARIVWLR